MPSMGCGGAGARLPARPHRFRLTDMISVLSIERDHPDSRERHTARKRAGFSVGSNAAERLCA